MRIANLMFGGKRGGIEQAVVDYSRALQSRGHDVTAFIRRGAAIEPLLQGAQLPYQALPAPHRWNFFFPKQLAKLLRGYDIAIVHGNRAGALARGLPVPVVSVAHSRFFKPYDYFDAMIALAPERVAGLREKTHAPIHVVPNMIALPETVTRPTLRTPPVVGLMGRLAPEKGIDLFIEALALLRAQGQSVRAIIGGDGALRAELEAKAHAKGVADGIEWKGWVENKQAFFESIDLFCLASRTENFPITLLEAIAHGCPSVATDCGGASAILTADSGLIVPISAEGIAQGIAQALADPEALQRMGQQARALAASRYAMPVVAAQLDAVVSDVMSKRSAA